MSVGVLGIAQNLSMQNGIFNRCEPDLFYDSGGEFGNYDDDENITTTICPINADEYTVVNFLSFSTQFNFDFLTIYDGDSTGAPVLGSFSGGVNPGEVQSGIDLGLDVTCTNYWRQNVQYALFVIFFDSARITDCLGTLGKL
jgi:hypothetical protein